MTEIKPGMKVRLIALPENNRFLLEAHGFRFGSACFVIKVNERRDYLGFDRSTFVLQLDGVHSPKAIFSREHFVSDSIVTGSINVPGVKPSKPLSNSLLFWSDQAPPIFEPQNCRCEIVPRPKQFDAVSGIIADAEEAARKRRFVGEAKKI